VAETSSDPERSLGVELFNKAWALMERPDRSPEADDELLHCAHASAYHWMHAGTVANRARSEWQCSRAYTVAGDAAAAREWLDRARAAGEKIVDEDDRVLLEADLATVTLEGIASRPRTVVEEASTVSRPG
jgi:hypothetical protein